jgi:hypothetical protein
MAGDQLLIGLDAPGDDVGLLLACSRIANIDATATGMIRTGRCQPLGWSRCSASGAAASAGPILLDPMQAFLPAFVEASGTLCRSR